MSSTKPKVDATDLAHQIAAFEENIARAEKNIIIFSDEVQKQKDLKVQLEAELTELKTHTTSAN